MRMLLAVVAALVFGSASAQPYPHKSIRLILAYAAGGAMDMSGRIIAPILQESLGQPVVVENRTGGAGNIGAEAVAKAAPDGYTILFFADAYTIAPSLFTRLPYDPVKDFIPITQMVSGAHILVGHPSVPANNLAELIDYVKKIPGSSPMAALATARRSTLLRNCSRPSPAIWISRTCRTRAVARR